MKISKLMNNVEIAELLRAVAASYKLKNENKNKFKIIAYERAADAVEHASSELKDLWDDDKLDEIPGVGKSIADHLDEIFRTGKSKHFGDIMKGLPPAMFDLMEVPGIGAKTAFRLSHELGIKSLKDLEKAAKKHHISRLAGFGESSEKDILKSLEEIKGRTKRHLLPYALQVATEIIEWLKKNKNVVRTDPLGSLRRKASTVGDIDISVSSKNPADVIQHFVNYPKSQRTIEKGTRTASIIIPGNIRVDLMVETPDAYGALLQHFTGSKHHNIALREYALKKNLSLSDYGIYEKVKGRKKLNKIATEEIFYNFIKMDWIPPELREDNGEIKAALEHRLPSLVDLKDIKSDLQIHSDFDIETSHDIGESSMEEIVSKANGLGYQYLAFTEHNPAQTGHTDRQIVEILKKKKESIEKLNYSIKQNKYNSIKKVFNSLEVDIKPDGSLPINKEAIETLDFFLISIHSSFGLERDKMTRRVLDGFSEPKAKIFAHPTARKINEREGVELNWPEIFEYCKKNQKWLEINCDPMRLDLPDVLVREAVKLGVKMTLGTDAHHKDGLNNIYWGVTVARRGWAEKKDIINCLTVNEFENLIK